jgi:NADPH:quinone reductase-like Zn-dependent oxidoreductase
LLAQEISATVWPLVCDGALRPEIDKIFPLAEAADAHAYMESGAHVGKIMLAV